MSTGTSRHLGHKPVQIGTAVEPTVGDNRTDPLRARDVLERVGVEQYEVRKLAWLYGSQRISHAQYPRRVDRGGLQGLQLA